MFQMDGVCRFFYVNISRFPESSAKEWVKVNIHFEGGGPGSPAKKNNDQQQPVETRDSTVMPAATLQDCEGVIPDYPG